MTDLGDHHLTLKNSIKSGFVMYPRLIQSPLISFCLETLGQTICLGSKLTFFDID